MARSNPRAIFGVHAAAPYRRSSGLPYGELRVIKGSSLSLSSELIELFGGSSKYAWAAEEGSITAEMTWNVGELPSFLFELFLGNAPTDGTTEASGNIGTAANTLNATIVDAANGITLVDLVTGSSDNLKLGNYVIKGLTASTFNLYIKNTLDVGRGTDVTILTDDLCVASAVAFTGSLASVPALGLQFTKTGTLAFGVGDTAEFAVRPQNTGYSEVVIGGVANQSFPEFGAVLSAQKRGNDELLDIDVYKCKAAGMPLPFEMGQFQGLELKIKVLYDSTRDGIFKMRAIKAT